MVVHWLRLCTPNTGRPSLTAGQGAISYMPQLKITHATAKILSATTKTWHSQISKTNIKKKREICSVQKNHEKIFSTISQLGELQIKTMRYHFTTTRMALLKRQTMTTVGKDVQELETSETVARNENGMVALKNSLAVPQDIKHRVTI